MAPFFARFDTLAIQNGGGGSGRSALFLSRLFAQVIVQALDHAVVAPAAEQIVSRVPGRQVMGQVPPGAACSELVEHGIDDFAQWVFARSSCAAIFGSRQAVLKALPLVIGQVG